MTASNKYHASIAANDELTASFERVAAAAKAAKAALDAVGGNPDGLYSGASLLRLVDAINAENKRRGIKVEFE